MTNSNELTLYIINDGYIYDHYIVPTIANLSRKHSKGLFLKSKALISFKRIADLAAKRYYTEINASGYLGMFTVDDRKATANELYEYYLDDILS